MDFFALDVAQSIVRVVLLPYWHCNCLHLCLKTSQLRAVEFDQCTINASDNDALLVTYAQSPSSVESAECMRCLKFSSLTNAVNLTNPTLS